MEKRNKRGLSFLRAAGFLLLMLLLSASAYLGSVLLQPREDAKDFSVQETQHVTRLQAGDFTDFRLLKDTFGAMLPSLPDVKTEGIVRNKEYGGQNVRYAQVQFENGACLTAVRPSFAAPMLLRKGLDVSVRTDVMVLRMPAVLAGKDEAHCVYFEYDNTAYAFYAEGMTEEAFLALTAALEKNQ